MIDLSKVEKLMNLMGQYGVDVVEAQAGSEKIALARNASHFGFFSPQQMSSGAPQGLKSGNQSESLGEGSSEGKQVQTLTATPNIDKKKETKIPEGTVIKSPFVGTFYRAPSPDSKAFVEIGSKVRKGQALCVIEAMKIMNEIESEADGEVVAILVDNAKSVEFSTPLFVIAPGA